MADIFISYARSDRDIAKALADDLTARGYEVWWDIELVGSDDFRDVIMEEPSAARAAIVIWSANSARSHFVCDEAGRALGAGKLISTRVAEFGADAVKMDVEGGIHAGENYVDKLLGLVAEADVILAIVGRDWLAMLDKADYQAPDETLDWVRIELEAAFTQGKRIIPVIVGKADIPKPDIPKPDIPKPDDLPASLKEFAYLNVLRVTNEGFKRDTQGLISELRHVLAQIADERRAQQEAMISGSSPCAHRRAPRPSAICANFSTCQALLSKTGWTKEGTERRGGHDNSLPARDLFGKSYLRPFSCPITAVTASRRSSNRTVGQRFSTTDRAMVF